MGALAACERLLNMENMEIRSLHKHNSKLMARVAEDKVRRIVETGGSHQLVAKNEDPVVVAMMCERLSRELHERTEQLDMMRLQVDPLEQRAEAMSQKMQKTALQQQEQQLAAKQTELKLREDLKDAEEKASSQRRAHEKAMRERRAAEKDTERQLRQELKENAQQADARHQIQEHAQHVAAEKMAGELRKELQRRAAAEKIEQELRAELLAAHRHTAKLQAQLKAQEDHHAKQMKLFKATTKKSSDGFNKRHSQLERRMQEKQRRLEKYEKKEGAYQQEISSLQAKIEEENAQNKQLMAKEQQHQLTLTQLSDAEEQLRSAMGEKAEAERLRKELIETKRKGVSAEYAIQHEKHQLAHEKGEVAEELRRAAEVEQRAQEFQRALVLEHKRRIRELKEQHREEISLRSNAANETLIATQARLVAKVDLVNNLQSRLGGSQRLGSRGPDSDREEARPEGVPPPTSTAQLSILASQNREIRALQQQLQEQEEASKNRLKQQTQEHVAQLRQCEASAAKEIFRLSNHLQMVLDVTNAQLDSSKTPKQPDRGAHVSQDLVNTVKKQ